MRRGEKGILLIMAVIVGGLMINNAMRLGNKDKHNTKLPFYTTAPAQLQHQGLELIRKYQCRTCHILWTVRDSMQSVPAPALDGIGSLKDEAWLYNYLSVPNPQSIIKSRLKKEYQMPSYAHIDKADRVVLARYLSSLKVEDWYLNEVKKAEYEKLSGKTMSGETEKATQ